ncbi:multiple RNA-binding domain-containing protein 1 isoform X2 [Humulus lupulus]|uniref:multiple RNA-binding domain-containing protein 1 isoform X2 n=1 Tax=Humulus lupulus TaxID=3486 RepID=UPI002B4016B7|nr:multiple RNA-binding domain-containing protein 1 isoform X2 [Humulus lupulus]
MSRICVKNLPKYAAEDRLREFFSQKGEITDAKLMRTKDGNSRQFAFVGYRTEHEAEEAIRYFNKSYFDTCRISCEIAHKVGDPNIPRPWSRYSSKTDEKTTKDGNKVAVIKNSILMGSEREKKNLKEDGNNEDPQVQEFLQVMQPRVKSKLWANDTLITSTTSNDSKVREKQTHTNKERIEKSATIHIESGGDENAEYASSPDKQVANNLESPAHDDVISDMDYFKSRVKKNWSESESSDSDDNEDDSDSSKESPIEQDVQEQVPNEPLNSLEMDVSRKEDEEEDSHEDSAGDMYDQDDKEVIETSRLFVRNLPYTATEEELEELFSKFGTVSEVHLVIDKDTKRPKGFAFVNYSRLEFAARHDVASQGLKSFKQRREEERKASEASGDTKAWNTLFMRPDAIAENIARTYGVRKGDLLDTEANDLAVRLALGETQVIKETKKALKIAGVNVESLEDFAAGRTDGMKRSNHVFLVKNLPYGSSDGELAKMFGKYGSLDKVILPPTKTVALVVFLEPAEARAAFKGLAYKRYKDAPLYLEWAPANILSQIPTPEDNEKRSVVVGEHDVKRAILEQHVEGLSDVDADPDRVESRSLFVKNLNFKTSDETLKKHFIDHMKKGSILSVKVKKHMKNGKNVSMGYGFVEFDSMETATSVPRDLQGTILEGHALTLQLSHAKKDGQAPKKLEKDKSSTKLLVKNIAFEATKKDIRQLFSPFGQIKSLRLPVKMGSQNHRGFAFVEFFTKQEAQNALQELSSTHLYGRHLVLERAKEGETFEELRARTAAHFLNEENGFQNPTKKRKNMAVLDEGKMKFQRTES